MENSYLKLREANEKKFNALPIKWAFNAKQFKELLQGWGLDPESEADMKKISSFPYGGFYLVKDRELIHKTMQEINQSEESAIAADKTGDGYIYEMFYYELANHEYGYTRDLSPTLDALAIDLEELNASPALLHGLGKAVEEIEQEEEARNLAEGQEE